MSLLEEFCLPVEAGDLDADGSGRQDPSKATPCASQDTSANPELSSVPRGVQAKTEQLSESCRRNAGDISSQVLSVTKIPIRTFLWLLLVPVHPDED